MADLTANAPLRFKGTPVSERWYLDTSTAQTIYRGQPMMIDQNVDVDNARGYVDATVVASNDVILGIAAEGKTVVSGDPEKTEIEVYVAPTWVGFKSTVFTTNDDLGKRVFMLDSGTLADQVYADNPEIGILRKIEDGYCYVELTTPKIPANA
jgi:hypothetical protein